MTITFSNSKKKNLKHIQLITLVTISTDYFLDNIITLSIDNLENLNILHDFFSNENIFFERLFLYSTTINTQFYKGLCYQIQKENSKDFLTNLSANFIEFNLSEFHSNIEKKISYMKKTYYIYMLRCNDNSIYTGIAADYKKRFKEHISQQGAKYTKTRLPIKIERVWKAEGRSLASKIEYFIKSLTKKQKEDLLINPLSLSTSFSRIILEL